jgi:S1-C subfamily serine protease
MRVSLILRSILVALALGCLGGTSFAQAGAETSSGPVACPKGYEALCNALNAPGAGSEDIGSQAGTGGKSTAIVRPESLETNEILRQSLASLSPSVVQIEIVNPDQTVFSKGTAFYITKDGYALTSARLLPDARESISVGITNSIGERSNASIVSIQQDAELALVKVRSSREQLSIIGAGEASPVGFRRVLEGEKVSVIGFTLELPYQVHTTGIVESLDGPKGRFFVNAVVNPGMTGSPVLGGDGQLIGVVSGSAQPATLTLVVPIGYASTLLQMAGIR